MNILNRINDTDDITQEVRNKNVIIFGSGFTNYNFTRKVTKKTVGVDISKEFIEEANKTKLQNESFFVEDITKRLDLPSKSFDICLIPFVLHHIREENHIHVIEEATRLAKQRIIIYDHIRNSNILKSTVQMIYWKIADGGLKYRTEKEWYFLLDGRKYVTKRYGAMFGNIIKIVIKTDKKCGRF
ncbi:MAG: class I SAM-dependent methyltransferase [Candidatus Aenigmatarchaeota archaeon]